MRSPAGLACPAESTLHVCDYVCAILMIYMISPAAAEKTDGMIPLCWVFLGECNVER